MLWPMTSYKMSNYILADDILNDELFEVIERKLNVCSEQCNDYYNIDLDSKSKFTEIDLLTEQYSVSDEVTAETDKIVRYIIDDLKTKNIEETRLGFKTVEGEIKDIPIFDERYIIKSVQYKFFIFDSSADRTLLSI